MIGSVLAEHLQHRSITIATGPGRGCGWRWRSLPPSY